MPAELVLVGTVVVDDRDHVPATAAGTRHVGLMMLDSVAGESDLASTGMFASNLDQKGQKADVASSRMRSWRNRGPDRLTMPRLEPQLLVAGSSVAEAELPGVLKAAEFGHQRVGSRFELPGDGSLSENLEISSTPE